MQQQALTGRAVVTVTAPARLHMGFLDLHGGLGRRFGSLGLALAAPLTRVAVQPAADLHVQGEESIRTARLAAKFAAVTGVGEGVAINVAQAIPPHSGLGSGTQLALATGVALARLHGLAMAPTDIAAALGRGQRSGIGIGAFEHGGFLVDGGHGADTTVPPLVAQRPFPDAWRMLLVFDSTVAGVHGTQEDSAFAGLAPFPETLAGHLCRLTLMMALPALAETDIQTFGQAITAIQRCVGEHFASAQGGVYTSAEVARALECASQNGAASVGQSSWGPTGFALCPSDAAAQQLMNQLRKRVGSRTQLRFLVCAARNAPGDITQGTNAASFETVQAARP